MTAPARRRNSLQREKIHQQARGRRRKRERERGRNSHVLEMNVIQRSFSNNEDELLALLHAHVG